MREKNSGGLDLGRKLNLIETMLNADAADPQARRLGSVVIFTCASVDQGYVEIDENDLWLSFLPDRGARLRVTDDNISHIIELIEGHPRR